MNLTNQTLSARKSQGSWGQWLPFDSSRLQAHPSKHSACGSAPARQCSCGSAPPREKTDQRSSSSQTPRKPCPSGRTHGMLTSQLHSMTLTPFHQTWSPHQIALAQQQQERTRVESTDGHQTAPALPAERNDDSSDTSSIESEMDWLIHWLNWVSCVFHWPKRMPPWLVKSSPQCPLLTTRSSGCCSTTMTLAAPCAEWKQHEGSTFSKSGANHSQSQWNTIIIDLCSLALSICYLSVLGDLCTCHNHTNDQWNQQNHCWP